MFSFANRFRCVLLLDELDSLAKVRDDPNEVGEIKRVVNALLQNMDSRSAVGVTLGITNHPQLLDPAVWRRFAVQVEIPMPVLEAREAIVRRVAAPVEVSDSLVALIAALLDGSAGSEVRSIVTLFKKRTVMQPPPRLTHRSAARDCLAQQRKAFNRSESHPSQGRSGCRAVDSQDLGKQDQPARAGSVVRQKQVHRRAVA